MVSLLLNAQAAGAAQQDIAGPLGSVNFGASVTVLPNGNFVVADPGGPVSGIGAVYIYSPNGTLISTLTGSTANDQVGSYGVFVVGGGNFVVLSPQWHNAGSAAAGAATWVNGTTGLNGVVSSANSLVGTTAGDRVGNGYVTVLSNGNYVVASPHWDNGVSNGLYGAATWGNGSTGVSGAVSASNSLVGGSGSDNVTSGGVVALSNGNYVVGSPLWHNAGTSVGAATWGNGITGTVGVVQSGNSLTGSTSADEVGMSITPLTNGNYVVSSPSWQNSGAKVGAATWVNGASMFSGVVSSDGAAASKSLVGTSNGDQVASGGIVALSDGNYVVSSPLWSGAISGGGAVTWGNGATGTAGPVLPGNSLIGSVAGESVGFGKLTALKNGNYVVGTTTWANGAVSQAGAATWIPGGGPFSGTITSENSLFGTTTGDLVGQNIVALSNGNYVVASTQWNDGVASSQFGAATWGNGSTGTIGPVLPAASLIGAFANDTVGTGGVLALNNGSYVVFSDDFKGSAVTAVGAWTWCRASGGTTGPVSPINSVVGSLASGSGTIGGGKAVAFSDGNYAIASPFFSDNVGAVTLASGAFRLKGTIAPWNSVIATLTNKGSSLVYDYDTARHRLIVGRPYENLVTLFTMDQVFSDDFDP
jgi:hypothetical protein